MLTVSRRKRNRKKEIKKMELKCCVCNTDVTHKPVLMSIYGGLVCSFECLNKDKPTPRDRGK